MKSFRTWIRRSLRWIMRFVKRMLGVAISSAPVENAPARRSAVCVKPVEKGVVCVNAAHAEEEGIVTNETVVREDAASAENDENVAREPVGASNPTYAQHPSKQRFCLKMELGKSIYDVSIFDLIEEFQRYGHFISVGINVGSKMATVAFSQDASRWAAISAWELGPRTDGPFTGQSFPVSKRNRPAYIRRNQKARRRVAVDN